MSPIELTQFSFSCLHLSIIYHHPDCIYNEFFDFWLLICLKVGVSIENTIRPILKDKRRRRKNHNTTSSNPDQIFSCSHCGRSCLFRILALSTKSRPAVTEELLNLQAQSQTIKIISKYFTVQNPDNCVVFLLYEIYFTVVHQLERTFHYKGLSAFSIF